MHCKNGRGLEVSVSVGIAPGRLSNYTKIVRICPRYVIVNQLSRPIVRQLIFSQSNCSENNPHLTFYLGSACGRMIPCFILICLLNIHLAMSQNHTNGRSQTLKRGPMTSSINMSCCLDRRRGFDARRKSAWIRTQLLIAMLVT